MALEEAIVLEELVSASNAQLVIIEAAHPIQVEAKPMQVDSVEVGDR